MARYIIFYQILCNVVMQKSTREVVLLLNVPQFNQYRLYITFICIFAGIIYHYSNAQIFLQNFVIVSFPHR